MGTGIAVDPDDKEYQSVREVVWRRVSFSVPVGAATKTILKECSGQISCGELCGILGPSGSGKTSLLDALAGRIDGSKPGRSLAGGISGVGHAAYVQQEDALVGVLTVRETMAVAAALAGGGSGRGSGDGVEALIVQLGLEGCANSPVGTIFQKGISGGQKRRLSIAVELIAEPSVLFLDEPTSGLDSASALAVLTKLSDIATNRSVVVLAAIHQPSFAAWQKLDVVSFMSKGQVVWFGDGGDGLLAFLGTLGYALPPRADVADFVLSLINDDFPGHCDVGELVAAFAATRPELAPLDDEEKKLSGPREVQRRRAGVVTRFFVLVGRGLKELRRDPGIIGVRLVMYTMLALLIGAMFYDLGGDKNDKSIVARVSILFYVAAFMVFMSVAVLPFVMMQREVFVKERCNGAYDVPEFVLARFVVSLPGVFMLALVTTVCVVLLAKLNGFGVYLLNLFVSLLVTESFIGLVAAIVPHYIIGIVVAAGMFGISVFGSYKNGPKICPKESPKILTYGAYVGASDLRRLHRRLRAYNLCPNAGMDSPCSARAFSRSSPTSQTTSFGDITSASTPTPFASSCTTNSTPSKNSIPRPTKTARPSSGSTTWAASTCAATSASSSPTWSSFSSPSPSSSTNTTRAAARQPEGWGQAHHLRH